MTRAEMVERLKELPPLGSKRQRMGVDAAVYELSKTCAGCKWFL